MFVFPNRICLPWWLREDRSGWEKQTYESELSLAK